MGPSLCVHCTLSYWRRVQSQEFGAMALARSSAGQSCKHPVPQQVCPSLTPLHFPSPSPVLLPPAKCSYVLCMGFCPTRGARGPFSCSSSPTAQVLCQRAIITPPHISLPSKLHPSTNQRLGRSFLDLLKKWGPSTPSCQHRRVGVTATDGGRWKTNVTLHWTIARAAASLQSTHA